MNDLPEYPYDDFDFDVNDEGQEARWHSLKKNEDDLKPDDLPRSYRRPRPSIPE
jgi:hypothetical protein